MGKNLATKLAIIVAVLLFFIYGIIGIPHSTGKGFGDSLKQALANNIRLGLDLQGGVHLVYTVNVAEAIGGATDRDVARIEQAMPAAGITGVSVAKSDPQHNDKLVFTGVTPANSAALKSLLSGNEYSIYTISTQPDGTMTATLTQSAIKDLTTRTLDQTIEVINDRINKLGVSESTVQKYGLGENQILVELPGVSDPQQVQDAIQSTSKLAIRAVVSGPYESEQAAMTALNNVIPPDAELVHGKATNGSPDEVWLLKRASEVEGTDFRGASAGTDQNGRPNIRFQLTTEAGDRFYKYTSAHAKGSTDPGSMAIVLGNTVRQVASINSAISDQGEIEGQFTQAEVDNVSLMLRTGALPASLTQTETRAVGPSLGAASIRQGVTAAILGMAAVMLFMLIYYKGSGINADLALILNLIILLGFMGYSHAVLTLPGIAGVILTIGMGVDSNVLIFERIREELRSGKTAASAVKEGFRHAWTTIVDTHVTTIVSAVILLMFGTGPVKGFAVTLMVGLFANLLTAVFVSRMIFDWHLQDRPKDAPLSI